MGQAWVYWFMLVAAVLFAAAAGGAPERITAAVFLTASVASRYLYAAPDRRFHQVEINVLAIDVLVLVSMAALVVCADRYWPILMTAVQALSVAGHLGRMVEGDWARLTYAVATVLPSYLAVLLLAAATLRHVLRVRRDGRDGDWNSAVVPPRGP